MKAISLILFVLISALAEVKEKRPLVFKGLEYYQGFEGVYTLDPRSNFHTLENTSYILVVLQGASATLEYYEDVREKGKFWGTEFKISVQSVVEPDSPSCESLTEVRVVGTRNGKVIYERIDIYFYNFFITAGKSSCQLPLIK